ncbi:hypothetical protein PUN28_012600 [Cardiocondyla obscurior]|uniref:GSK-3-binding protein-like n=1 Tax=Cardiocondyla obscurior TaxID=286306 RepID=A0AAW2FC68_9HYME
MPSAEETTYLIGMMPDGAAQADAFLTRDVDLLVSQIKENLRLSSLKAKSSISQKNSRPSPYRVPARSWADPAAGCEVCGLRSSGQQQQQQHHVIAGHHHHHHYHHSHLKRSERSRVDDDPYEVLQELLREGGLIKEAVKRLQKNLDELSSSEVDDDDVVDDEDDVRQSGGTYRRKPYFYDSEDEPLPPMYEPLEL